MILPSEGNFLIKTILILENKINYKARPLQESMNG